MKQRQTIYTVYFRRRREGRTNYSKRLRLLLAGTPRMVVRRSLRRIIVQLVEFDAIGDRIIASANSGELKKYGWAAATDNTPAAYLTGLLFGKRATKKAQKAVLDIGLHASIKGSRIYAAVKGAMDSGLGIPCSSDVLPRDDRIKGEHIKRYYDIIKKESKDLQFSKTNASDLPVEFEAIKKKITEE